jgi:hypothetical protein
MAQHAVGQLESVVLEGRIIRADGTVEELGTLAYWHRNPLRRLVGRLKQRGGPLAGRLHVKGGS